MTNQDEIPVTNYENKSKWFTERMQNIYEMMMEHESKWLDDEKEQFEQDNVLPEENLHDRMPEFRETDAKELNALAEALNKHNLNESPEDIGSSENKRLNDEDNSSENKKSKIESDNNQSIKDSSNNNDTTDK